MSVLNNAAVLLLGGEAGGGGGYEIERSLRFNSSDSVYLGARCVNRIEYVLTSAQLQEVAA